MSDNFQYTKAQRAAIRLLNGPAGNVMLFGGSRSGKTFVICANVMMAAVQFPGLRVAILRRYLKDVRESILLDTFPKVLRLRFKIDRAGFEKMLNKSDLYLEIGNGSQIWFGGLDDSARVEKILGKEYGLIYFNEVSQIPYTSIEIAKTRLAMKVLHWRNRCYYDCNPTPKNHWVYRMFVEKVCEDRTPLPFADDFVSFRMNPGDNARNISRDYLEKTLGALTGRSRDRFVNGNWSEVCENALWRSETMIDPYRINEIPDDLERIVVAVDPAVTHTERSDHTGIVVVGRKQEESSRVHYYVLADYSLVGTPVQWARRVVEAYHRFQADRVVAEVNQGGDLVVSVLENVEASLPVKRVHASRGKIIRAEPIAGLYEQGLVHHVGAFPELEEELCSYAGGELEDSPDRMDALVWGLTELTRKSTIEIGNFRFV
ncbi:MAG: phage terminase large subunit [Planctomycetia bacterium]|nr:phage terminase large subunit [Planctomycetia bacterium]